MKLFFDLASPALYVTAGIAVSLFVAFGIWSLHQRFQKQQEWGVGAQVLALSAVLFFYVVEILTLREVMRGETVYFIFSVLGLLVAGLALYGHMAVSLLSRLMVEMILPDNPAAAGLPRLGPAEILEHQGDWEGALNEYFVLAQVYPGNPVIYARIANNLLRLGQPEDACRWFERTVKYATRPGDAADLLKRLMEACIDVENMDAAREAALLFLQRFPREEEVRKHLESLSGIPSEPALKKQTGKRAPGKKATAPITGAATTPQARDILVPLEQVPTDNGSPKTARPDAPPPESTPRPSLQTLNDHPLNTDTPTG